MNGKLKVAFSCYAIAALLLLVFALVYLTRSEFMPYHSDAVGLEWAEVDPAFGLDADHKLWLGYGGGPIDRSILY